MIFHLVKICSSVTKRILERIQLTERLVAFSIKFLRDRWNFRFFPWNFWEIVEIFDEVFERSMKFSIFSMNFSRDRWQLYLIVLRLTLDCYICWICTMKAIYVPSYIYSKKKEWICWICYRTICWICYRTLKNLLNSLTENRWLM